MKKTANADIRNLFQKFGGDTGNYQEIQQDYAMNKAQQSWPIVNAIEKAHVAAPKLRATPPANRMPPAQAAPHGHSPDGMRSLSAALAKPAAAAPTASTLFGSLNRPVRPAPTSANAPLRSLFGALNETAHPAPAKTLPAQTIRSENDPLNTVFSRLLNPQEAASAPDKNLRNLLGFLNK